MTLRMSSNFVNSHHQFSVSPFSILILNSHLLFFLICHLSVHHSITLIIDVVGSLSLIKVMSNQTKLKTHPTNEHTCHQAIIMGRFLQEQGSGFRIGFTASNRLNESKSVKYFQFSQLFEHFLYSNVYVGNVGHYVLHLSIFLLLGVKDEMRCK